MAAGREGGEGLPDGDSWHPKAPQWGQCARPAPPRTRSRVPRGGTRGWGHHVPHSEPPQGPEGRQNPPQQPPRCPHPARRRPSRPSNRARFITRSRVRGARKRRCRGGSSGYCCKALGRGCLPAPRGPSPTARLETPPFPSPEEKVRTEKRKEGAHGEGGGEGTPRAVPQCRGSPQFSAYVRGRRARGRGGGGEGHAERSPGWGRLSSRGSTLWSFFGAREGF